jgi:hypothetical protein
MTLLIAHVQKTGGLSLRRLVAQFHPDAQFVYGGQLRLAYPDIDYIREFRARPRPSVVMGHFGFGVHRFLGLAPAYVSVLREPVQRVVSLYRMEKSQPNSPFRDYFESGRSLCDFVTDNITELTNNHMCRVIAGVPMEAGLLINDRWLLELAIHNLRRHYVLVGTLERYELFLAALGRRLNWGNFDIPRENVAAGPRVELDRGTRAAIVERNSLDMALFDYVNDNYR